MQQSATIKVQTDQSTTTISRTSQQDHTTNENNDTDIFVVCSYGDLSDKQ